MILQDNPTMRYGKIQVKFKIAKISTSSKHVAASLGYALRYGHVGPQRAPFTVSILYALTPISKVCIAQTNLGRILDIRILRLLLCSGHLFDLAFMSATANTGPDGVTLLNWLAVLVFD